jgi:membrane associated rhomboid family serine protease
MTQVPPPSPYSAPQPVVPVCYRHPKRETYVRCTRCNRPICPECMSEASVGHQCPECVAEGRKSQRQVKSPFGGTRAGAHGYVTITLIVINVLFELISLYSAHGKGAFGGGWGGLLGSDSPLTNWGAVVGQNAYTYDGAHVAYYVPAGVATGEYYRLFTNMFIHYGLLHLAMNMWALWVIGRVVEAMLGPVRYIVLYMMAGLGGSVAVYLFSPHSPTVGASGAIFGLFGALFVLLRKLRRDTSAIIPVLVLNLVFTFSVPGISIAGHIGGLITGGVLAFAMAYAPVKHRNVLAASAVTALVLLFAVAVIVQTHALQGIQYA